MPVVSAMMPRFAVLIVAFVLFVPVAQSAETRGPAPGGTAVEAELELALRLADLLRAARSVIAAEQSRINDPELADKGLTGAVVVSRALAGYEKARGVSPLRATDSARARRAVESLIVAIDEVMRRNQGTINRPGTGFKGFVPAVFARLVNEAFRNRAGDIAEIKVTAPMALVRNRKARPDDWEARMIAERFPARADAGDDAGVVAAVAPNRGRDAFRVLVPEYYSPGCLSCHGGPAGSLDVTGYPREGGEAGQLGGLVSVTLYRPG